MTPFLRLAICVALLTSPGLARADVTESFQGTTANPTSGLKGQHFVRSSGDTNPFGLSLDRVDDILGTVPVWELGTYTHLPSGLHDFGVFSHSTLSHPLLLRPDTGQMTLGRAAAHPSTDKQVVIVGGTDPAPLFCLNLRGYGNYASLQLTQLRAGTFRSNINMNGKYEIGTDTGQNGTHNWYLWNSMTTNHAIVVNSADVVAMSYGATIGGALRHTAPG